jgi:hypothetical protein
MSVQQHFIGDNLANHSKSRDLIGKIMEEKIENNAKG